MFTVEVVGAVLMWTLVPLAWLWIGGRVYAATGSLAADGGVALFGFAATAFLLMVGLIRVDRTWVAMRRQSGHPEAEGALSQIVVVSVTFALLLFMLWYYVLTDAYVMPFMPSQ